MPCDSPPPPPIPHTQPPPPPAQTHTHTTTPSIYPQSGVYIGPGQLAVIRWLMPLLIGQLCTAQLNRSLCLLALKGNLGEPGRGCCWGLLGHPLYWQVRGGQERRGHEARRGEERSRRRGSGMLQDIGLLKTAYASFLHYIFFIIYLHFLQYLK